MVKMAEHQVDIDDKMRNKMAEHQVDIADKMRMLKTVELDSHCKMNTDSLLDKRGASCESSAVPG